MRRLTTYFNSLLLGVILGMTFVAIVHAPISHRHEKVRAHALTIGYEIVGAKDQTTVLLIAGTTIHVVRLPAGLCAHLVNQGCDASPSVTSASLVIPATHQQVGK
ncbi:MAG TPA: hypothetical protein VK574_02075 [Terracidiphilus sp.]|nr:hypothetical protein [Terracidiphilus sp.]